MFFFVLMVGVEVFDVSGRLVAPAHAQTDADAWKGSLQALWPNVQKVYPYLGSQGLLIAILYGQPAAGPTAPVRFVSTAIVGAGDSPAAAWAMNNPEAHPSGQKIAPDASWFIWITPSARGYPADPPNYEAVASMGLFGKKVNYQTVVDDGVAIRSRLISDAGYKEVLWLSQLGKTALAAEQYEATSSLRQTAAALRDSAIQAQTKLTDINAKLAEALRQSAKAEDSLKILSGIQHGITAGSKIADNWDAAMQFLDGDAPTPDSPIDNGTKAQDFIIVVRDNATKARTELLAEKSSLESDVQNKLAAFRQSSPGASLIPGLGSP